MSKSSVPAKQGGTASAAGHAGDCDETVWAPSSGAYLTDEIGLFRVVDAFSNAGELFMELENCATLGLVLCPARAVTQLGLRIVIPASSALAV